MEDVDPKPAKIKQVYTIRDVINQNHSALVKEEIPYAPTDTSYIGSYQHAVNLVLAKMSSSNVEEAEAIAEMWNKQGAPLEVQLKWVFYSSMLCRFIFKFSQEG